ncbi:MAG: NIPSNAP family protein [Caulobacteraceae bacterium]
MTITCCIRYEIDLFERDAFEAYAAAWGEIIPACGGELVGYFVAAEGDAGFALALINFADLSAYQTYRQRLAADPDARANFTRAREGRFIRREVRSFLKPV